MEAFINRVQPPTTSRLTALSIVQVVYHEKIRRHRDNALVLRTLKSEAEFTERFRVTLDEFESLFSVISSNLQQRRHGLNVITARVKLLIFLRFAASGADYLTLQDLFQCSKSSVQRAIHLVG